jgi:hypothetical protein
MKSTQILGVLIVLGLGFLSGCTPQQEYCSFAVEQHYPSGEVLQGNQSFPITSHPTLVIHFGDNVEHKAFTEEIYWSNYSELVIGEVIR